MTAVVGLAPQDFAQRCRTIKISNVPKSVSLKHLQAPWNMCEYHSITDTCWLQQTLPFCFDLLSFPLPYTWVYKRWSVRRILLGKKWVAKSFVVPGAVCDCGTGIFDIPGLIALLDPFLWLCRFYELHVPSMPSPSRWNIARWMGAALTQGKYFWSLKRSGVKLFMESKKAEAAPESPVI